jgi:protein-tyrosine-phosphatase
MKKGLFGRAISNFSKVLFSSGNGFLKIIINSKRNSLIKLYENYADYTKVTDENKRNVIVEKYEKQYEAYLDLLERYIKETVYSRVQKGIGSLKENKVLSEYYYVMSIKGNEYIEFKKKRQLLLLDLDWEMVLSIKNDRIVKKYKEFYLTTTEQIYKSLMRHYAVLLTDPKYEKDDKYEKIYNLIEDYIKIILPYKPETEENKSIIEAYKKYVLQIDTFAKKEYNQIKKSLIILELSRQLFLYSLPMIAAEQCYIKLMKQCRSAIVNSILDTDKFELYELLLDLIESYNINVLSQKVYWDSPTLREDYKKFWDKFKELKKLERIDYDDYKKQREILFITYDTKLLTKSKKSYKDIKEYYRIRMIEIGGLRQLKNWYKNMNGIWRTRRKVKMVD